MLVELRCPGCNAPVDTSQGRVIRCRYCGASLLVQEPPAGERRETYAVSLEPVGPSNREGVAKLIVEHVGLSQAEALALVGRAPCDVVTWDSSGRADEFRRALVDRGARASVVKRFVEIPAPILLPAGDVWLDDAGSNKIAVIKVVRKYLDLGLKEAKELIDSAPCALVKGLEGSRANAFIDALVGVGAHVRKG